MIRKNNKLGRSTEEDNRLQRGLDSPVSLDTRGLVLPGPCHVCKCVCGLLGVNARIHPFRRELPLSRGPETHLDRDALLDGVSLARSPDSLARRPRLGHIAVPLQCLLRAEGGGEHPESLSLSSWVITYSGVLPNPQPPHGKLGFCFCGIELYEFFLKFGY